MRIEAIVPVWRDDANSYPPELKVEVSDEWLTFKLDGPEREITIKRTEFDALVRYINV